MEKINNMDDIIEKVKAIKNVDAQIEEIYAIADSLEIKYTPSKCHRCRVDLLNIIKEELKMIESAADESEFNDNPKYKYLKTKGVVLDGVVYDQYTDVRLIEKFMEKFHGYYEKINNENNIEENED